MSSNDVQNGQSKSQARKKRVACIPCREAKLKCESQRPCSRCVKKGKQEDCKDPVTRIGSESKDIQHVGDEEDSQVVKKRRLEENNVFQKDDGSNLSKFSENSADDLREGNSELSSDVRGSQSAHHSSMELKLPSEALFKNYTKDPKSDIFTYYDVLRSQPVPESIVELKRRWYLVYEPHYLRHYIMEHPISM